MFILAVLARGLPQNATNFFGKKTSKGLISQRII